MIRLHSRRRIIMESNAQLDLFPDNNPSHFKTRLPEPWKLDDTWEVSLLQLRLPHTWYNVKENQISFQWVEGGGGPGAKTLYLEAGLYSTVQDLVEAILSRTKAVTSKAVALTLDEKSGHYSWTIPENCSFIYPKLLARLLGYIDFFTLKVPFYLSEQVSLVTNTEEVVVSKDHTMPSRYKDSIWAFISPYSFQNIYVQCNISEQVYVGSQMAKILLIHGIRIGGPVQENIVSQNPTFYRLSAYEFRDIEIKIRDNLNRPIPFQRGSVSCTLYFRRRAVPR